MKRINLLVLILICVGCTRESSHSTKASNLDYSEQEVKLSFPTVLWSKITDRYKDDQKFIENKYDFFTGIPMSISLTAEKKGVLNSQYIQIGMSTFGGKIDFAELLGTKEKDYIDLHFAADLTEEEMKGVKVYYVSNARKRKIASEQIGNGCNVLLDLTDYFHKEIFKRNMPLHTGQLRYVSAVAGTFYFVAEEPHQLRISQITFTDSRFPETTCEERI